MRSDAPTRRTNLAALLLLLFAAQTIVRGLAVRWHEPEPAVALDFLRELGWREVIAGSARLDEVAARAAESERARCYLGKGGAAR
jgi:hypothetical protein